MSSHFTPTFWKTVINIFTLYFLPKKKKKQISKFSDTDILSSYLHQNHSFKIRIGDRLGKDTDSLVQWLNYWVTGRTTQLNKI